MAKRKGKQKGSKIKIMPRTILFSLVIVLFSLFYLYNFVKFQNSTKFVNHSYIKAPIVVKTPSKEVTSKFKKELNVKTKKPSPTEVPLTGFCLNVPVLMYHHIQPQENAKQLGQTALTVDSTIFDNQMAYLAQNGYTSYFANDFINALITHQQLAPKSIVITIDDGYEDNFIYALPILKKYGIRANIMLATGLMGNSNMLSWDEVKDLKNSGLVYFTNHTWSHYAINQGPQEKIEYEINTAQKEIQDYTGELTTVFTYPYGAINDNAITTLAKLGYTGAFSEIPGRIQCDSFLMTLHRTRIGNGPLSSYGL